MKVDIVITGMHRSGTTWLGRALSKIAGIEVLNEPFNVDHGVKGVPRWYLDHRIKEDINFAFDTFREIESGIAKYRWDPSLKKPLKSLAKLFVGNREKRFYKKIVLENPNRLVIKDPFLLMLTPELIKREIKTIVSVRHPGALLLSLRRMQWHVPNEHLIGRDPAGEFNQTRNGEIKAICEFWNAVYRPTLDILNTNASKHLFLVDHSSIFEDVLGFGNDLSSFLDLNLERSFLFDFLKSSTSGDTVNPVHKKQHDFTRDSKMLANSWRKSYSSKELTLFDQEIGSSYEKIRNWHNF
jgi:hypothetical protein